MFSTVWFREENGWKENNFVGPTTKLFPHGLRRKSKGKLVLVQNDISIPQLFLLSFSPSDFKPIFACLCNTYLKVCSYSFFFSSPYFSSNRLILPLLYSDHCTAEPPSPIHGLPPPFAPSPSRLKPSAPLRRGLIFVVV